MLRHSLSSVSGHDSDWDMCTFLAQALACLLACEQRGMSQKMGKNTAGTLMGRWEKENCVNAKMTDKALPYLV